MIATKTPIKTEGSGDPMSHRKKIIFGLATYLVATTIVIACLTSYGVMKFGSVAASVDFLRGHRLLFDSPAIFLGTIATDSTPMTTIVLHNHRQRPIRILKIKPSCSCIASGEWPEIIPASGEAQIPLKVRVDSKVDAIRENLVIYTDDDLRPLIRFDVIGVVAKH